MRLVDCVSLLLVITALLLASCDASSATMGADRTSTAMVAPIDGLLSTQGGHERQKRYLRSDATTANDEAREIIPASVRIALKRLVTKDETIYTHGRGKGGEKEWWAKVLKYYTKAKEKFDKYFRTPFWYFRFLVWAANKRTPEMMYYKLNVISTTGIGDKNYRIYVNYLRFYEFFHGPTYNPLIVYGPKLKTD
ncbi:hypothetical protein F441_06984 [Phytophthora nicotianae CJ01A1]|uniref:RxLR effector protein n=3 Tax=Phytophthora nicotianae TaxID=4792 RepID=V9FX21_PHYNI|nr:hypothetical protein F443_01998 [Phytophthora nicotianae P1569]ETK88984.1 hypothetical protein L915_06853 [Phytophthora nicotianae]ETL42390.1 hypothetical protein L916_06796 [Phytophthora nicotianae]ETM48755.1 hypothetical protein L914_06760 [Phytophthora nicotianae]ETP18891.1 hypothetical protein F441_06984 [Phytophthora nicotianae CJ01A1]